MSIDYTHFKEKLEAEKKLLEKEMGDVGRKNPDNPTDWEAVPTDDEPQVADENLAADRIEGYEENAAILNTLETRYQELKEALNRIEKSTYGKCSVCGTEIDVERLEANPSASTCRQHMQ